MLYTTRGLPYLHGTDPIADYPEHSRMLAEVIDQLLPETGRTTVTPSAANVNTSKHVDFVKPYFDPPDIQVSLNTSVPNAAEVSFLNVTTTGFDVVVNRVNTTNTVVSWAAFGRRTVS